MKSLYFTSQFCDGAIRTILFLKECGILPNKKNKILASERTNYKKVQNLINYTLIETMLQDRYFLENALLGREIKCIWGTEIEKGKEYLTLKLELEELP